MPYARCWASRFLLFILALCFSSAGFADSAVQRWAKEKVLDRIKLSGYRNLGYHIHTVSGDRDAFDISNYGGFGDQRFTNLGYVRVDGSKVFGWLNFEANLQDARFVDPQAQRYRLWISEGRWSAEYGDIQGQMLNTNQFARLNRNASGVAAGYKSRAVEFRVVRSDARGQARTVTLQGNNSPGPYYLQSSQIIRGSERIEVDGVPQVFGSDYTVDYDLGAITFVNRQTLAAKVIPPTSSIVATYESFAFSGGAGRLEAAGLSLDLGKAGKVGLVGMRQVTGASGRLSTRLEKFQGFGPPSTPYFLQFEPFAGQPIVIRVDGILQVEGADYRFDTNNPSIFYFNRFMPANQNIDVIYTPKPTTVVSGDREVMGFDYRLNIGTGTSIIYSQATGKTTNTPTPSSGTARGLQIRSGYGPWVATANVRDIPGGYVSIENTSFSRNERASDFSVTHSSPKNGFISVRHTNASILSQSVSGSGTTTSRTRFTRSGVDYTISSIGKSAWPLNLAINRSTTKNALTDNTVDSADLSTSRSFGKLTARLGLENQHVTGTSAADIFGGYLRTSYLSNSDWIFSIGGSLNKIRAGGKSGTGRELSASVVYRPSDRFSVTTSYTDSDAGSVASLSGFQSGVGVGFGGNGFSSGSSSLFSNSPTNGRTLRLVTDWSVNNRLNFATSFVWLRSRGNLSANAETQAASLNLDYDFGKSHRVNLSLGSTSTNFLDSPLESSSSYANIFFSGGPIGRLSYRADISTLLSSGTSQFQQDSFAYSATLDYNLGKRQVLSFQLDKGATFGYLPQDELNYSLSYRYQIYRGLDFNLSYTFRDVQNDDPLVSSGAYRSRGFDVGLLFRFGQ
ncbi:hypothetical protein QPK87_31485 [Kamptonema cortianum]|nr:hypothetical protein [Geitlerinema splendidum]MDK3161047.1 hypothetical protein [Kamptonema cortianum]